MFQNYNIFNRILNRGSFVENRISSSMRIHSGIGRVLGLFAGFDGLKFSIEKQTSIDDTNSGSGENFTDDQMEILNRVLHVYSPYVVNKIRAMGQFCHSAWQYACMLAVMDDHGIINSRYSYTDFARLLFLLDIPKRNNPKSLANSIRYTMAKLPTKYKSWGQRFKKEHDFCEKLATCLDSSMPYRYLDSRA